MKIVSSAYQALNDQTWGLIYRFVLNQNYIQPLYYNVHVLFIVMIYRIIIYLPLFIVISRIKNTYDMLVIVRYCEQGV